MKGTFLAAGLTLLIGTACLAQPAAHHRSIPRPYPSHPGNIFLEGEAVRVPAPEGYTGTWRAVDYEGKLVKEGRFENGLANLGKLPVGYYEIGRADGAGTIVSAGVLAPLKAPTPRSSPIGTDIAMAWLVPAERMQNLASLCTLAGINWVRDRLDWTELEPAREQFVSSNRYDFSIGLQAAARLQILQVSHRSPAWANPHTARFPLDLRDAYTYHRELAKRWRDKVVAFEPWNEADVPDFGGHTGSEMAAMQKASWLGLKAGNPNVIACLNVFALHDQAKLTDLAENRAWPYFDTFNLHHYEAFARYPQLYADFRAVSAGRPLWVTECSLPVKWHGDPQAQEPTAEDLRVQSERMAITYALILHEKAEAVFYFILPHFVEGQTQFGLLRRDLTPRPSFLALAAVGRLLADAKPLGRVQTGNERIQAYLFQARPDGKASQVLVFWSEDKQSLALPKPPRACYDHLGRPLTVAGKLLVAGPAPTFALLASGTACALQPPPGSPPYLPGRPSPVVLQALMPESSLVLAKSSYTIAARGATRVPLFAYNFGEQKVRGTLQIDGPEGWELHAPAAVELLPGDRKEIELSVEPKEGTPREGKLRVTGSFGSAGEATLSLRLIASP
jgi:hypothetical protein